MRIFKRGQKYGIDFFDPTCRKRIRKLVGPKKVAETVLKDIEVKIAKKQWLGLEDKVSMTFNEFLPKYLELSKQQDCDSHYRSKKRNLEVHVAPILGERPMNRVSLKEIEAIKIEISRSYSPASVNRILAYIKHLFSIAQLQEEVDSNPVKKVKFLKEPAGRLRYLSKQEINRLLGVCKGEVKDFIRLALNTGLRRGEVLSLKWSDIDFCNKMIVVQESKSGQKGVIPMNQEVYNVLRNMRKKRKGEEKVFHIGKHISRKFAQSAKEAGIENVRLHDLRHTFASYLAMKGCNLITIQKLLRHKTLNMVLRYAHLSQPHLQEAVKNLY